MDRRTIGTKNPGRCREVAAIERWPLVEVRLCNVFIFQWVVAIGERVQVSFYYSHVSSLARHTGAFCAFNPFTPMGNTIFF